MQAHDTDAPGSTQNALVVTTTGTGMAAQLGQFSFTQDATVNIAVGLSTGSGHGTAANGDSFDTAFAGVGEQTPYGIRIKEINDYRWNGSIRRRTGKLHYGASGKRGDLHDLRLIPGNDHSAECNEMTT